MAASSRSNHAVAPPADDKLPLTVAIIALNAADQRVRVDLADGSRWEYGYDALGQVERGRKIAADGGPPAWPSGRWCSTVASNTSLTMTA